MDLFKPRNPWLEELETTIDLYRQALEDLVAKGNRPEACVVIGARIDPDTNRREDVVITVDIESALDSPEKLKESVEYIRQFSRVVRAKWSIAILPGSGEVFDSDSPPHVNRAAVAFVVEVLGERNVDSRIAFLSYSPDGSTGTVESFGVVSCIEGAEAFRNLLNPPSN